MNSYKILKKSSAVFFSMLISSFALAGEMIEFGQKKEVLNNDLFKVLATKNGLLTRFPVGDKSRETYTKESALVQNYLENRPINKLSKELKKAIDQEHYYYLVWVSCEVYDKAKLSLVLESLTTGLSDNQRKNALLAYCVNRMVISNNIFRDQSLNIAFVKDVSSFIELLSKKGFDGNKLLRLQNIDKDIMSDYIYNLASSVNAKGSKNK